MCMFGNSEKIDWIKNVSTSIKVHYLETSITWYIFVKGSLLCNHLWHAHPFINFIRELVPTEENCKIFDLTKHVCYHFRISETACSQECIYISDFFSILPFAFEDKFTMNKFVFLLLMYEILRSCSTKYRDYVDILQNIK